MSDKKIPLAASAFKFPNGNVAVCDSKGVQISALQGVWTTELESKIRINALHNCEYYGF